MGKYFGTDGIRGIAGKTFTQHLINKVGKALVKFYDTHKLKRVLLVGNDSRISSDWILSIMQSTLLKHGIEVHNIGVCTSPALAYLTHKFGYPLSMMISASHNPHEYNGIKFFNELGEKISEQVEQEIERFMDKKFSFKINYATAKNKENLKAEYIKFLKSIKKSNLPCVIDCAFGGASEIAKFVFPTNKIINQRHDGKNINLNAGCTHIEFLRSICSREHKIGFAFDGDADRLIAVDEAGEIFDGDKILFILSKFFQKRGDILVGTIYTNSGLEKALAKNGVILKRAQVGDKLVYEAMKNNASNLGGENSGHIILKQFTNTGDGLLNAIVLTNILSTTKKTLKQLTLDYAEFYQASANLKLGGKFEMTESVKTKINEFENLGARIIVRPSGTEPVLRIMVEHQEKEMAEKFLEELKKTIC